MKRYHIFPLFIGLAAVALLAVSLLVSPASAADHVYSASIDHGVADLERAFTLYAAPEVAFLRQDDDGVSLRLAALAAPALHPDYAESLMSDALNFVETRLRC